ncbi:prolyl 4-hydroxylase subunit alpha-2 isoform X2 [Drosophila gunungcola]|uniref:prolyl 4-hydroxylase subunit alpha-2 isoform X2 n=1 Tax=Drosophila gunungcola TaxID=103775 RepID=UPI0022E3D538|nr:prolyl 4-hydroxylase subunit alpha-2 isoform X2 [Drosophila gunungcola]
MYSIQNFTFIGFLSVCTTFCQIFGKEVPMKSYAASTVELMKLLEVEDELVDNLRGYVEVLKKKLHLVEHSLITMNSEHNQMQNDYEMYLGNPVNSFRLIHHLHTDWRKWHHFALNTNNNELGHIEKAHRMRKLLPTALDLEHACRGIDDLMSFYDLKPEDLAAGSLAGHSKPETALSARDCLALGEFCIGNRNEDRAEAWFNTSLAKNETKFNSYTVHSSWGALQIKNNQLIAASFHFGKKPKELSYSDLDMFIEKELATNQNCSALSRKPSRLLCRYNTSTTAFTRIAPLKMEELSTDPYMVVFHDVIYDSEIDLIMNSSEFSLSLIDVGQKSEVRMEKGERIATVLFYLGDVDSGGDTIFPLININVTPKKGSAVFWYNLHNSGAVNEKSLHSACPVISGSKYVLTKWINELPQAFSSPCIKNASLHPDSNNLK